MTKILHLSLLLIVGIFILPKQASCQEKNWTFLVYLVGADLESKSNAGTNDIIEMINAGATENVNVVVLTGGADKDNWRTPTAQLYHDGEETVLDFNASGKQMSNAENVTAFVDWALLNYPGEKVALTFWNHGSDIRGYGNDEVSGKNLSVPKIKEALANTDFIKNNNKFELLGFDACLMGNLETVSTLGSFSNWYIGSEEQEPGHGWNYTPIIQALNNASSTYAGNELGKVIVDGFFAQAAAEETTALTLGVVRTSSIPDLENSLSTLFQQLVADNTIKKLHKARAKAEEYSKSVNNPEYSEDMVDIGDLMVKFKAIAPEYSTLIDDVSAKLSAAVSYNRKDMARPRSSGLSMYIPHNVLVDENELYSILDTHYYAIDFKVEIKNFIYDDYTPQALADKFPPNGTHDPDFEFFGPRPNKGSNRFGVGEVSAIRVSHDDDLEQVQVLLIEELSGFPNEYLMLGATHPDTIVYNDQGTDVYAYKWDEKWLGINGHPAYISDIYEYEVEETNGDIAYYTRIQIPAVNNIDQDNEEYLIISYRYDEDFNYVLESIIPEPYDDGNGGMIIPKDRVQLKPGDQLQLLYEGFNEVTDEEFFVVDDGAIIVIENGNEDLELVYTKLDIGNYQIGYLLEDHSMNDTLIFDPTIYTVMSTGLESIENENYFELYPNPTSNTFSLQLNELNGQQFELKIYDMMGRMVHSQLGNQASTSLSLGLANGIYTIEVILNNKRISDRLIIQN